MAKKATTVSDTPSAHPASPEAETTTTTSQFPFKTVFSFAPLIEYVNSNIGGQRSNLSSLVAELNERLSATPRLQEPIEDLSLLDQHRESVDWLMSMVFPPAFWDRDCSTAVLPSKFAPLYATPAFRQTFLEGEYRGSLAKEFNSDWAMRNRAIAAYVNIARSFFNLTIDFTGYLFVVALPSPDTGLLRYYRLNFDIRFIRFVPTRPLPQLTEQQRQQILCNLTDLDVWQSVIPPDLFQIEGFVLLNAVDVSDHELVGALERELVQSSTIVAAEGFQRLQQIIRAYLRRKELVIGLVAMDGDTLMVLNYGAELPQTQANACVLNQSYRVSCNQLAGSTIERALLSGQPQVIEDVLQLPTPRSAGDETLMTKGFRSAYFAPLHYNGALIGGLNIYSPNPGDLTELNTLKLTELLPLFSMVVHRSLVDMENQVQSVIRQQYTAVHPSVEWKFRQAAKGFITRQGTVAENQIEPIVFHDVYPLFSVSDIRGSSDHRNQAIQHDLIEQLSLAWGVIDAGCKVRQLPILDHLLFRIHDNIARIESGLHSGDEAGVLDFLRHEVESLFGHIGDFGPAVAQRIDDYNAALDPEIHAVYRKRKEFEESVTAINRVIAAFVESEEERAQGMFPHYFEKHQTDGVDFGVYVGQSLVNDRQFNDLYLRNLRLWQLLVMCGAARLADEVKSTLTIPLDTTHLVLVQTTPLSISYRLDEKQFDVDGAYNIRYAIMKKRIDKAEVKGTKERLTQPGKLAIVYSQPREAQEYRQYLEFLAASRMIEPGIEELDLEDLQGVHGLKALRVNVVLQPAADEVQVPEAIERAIREFSEAN
ncbi:MAG: GAF domain-containing protein [Armatimonadetes bacterium]|nr:GAF domain-containing protein [Armatimonadota bacterium]